MDREPVAIVAIAEVLALVFAAFGLDLTTEALVVTITTLVAIGAFVARKFAWSGKSVEKERALAHEQGRMAGRIEGRNETLGS